MNIADRIQHLRKTKGLSQEELADHIGVSRQAVSKWESEQSTPDISKIIIMSDYFEVTTDYLLKGIESVKKEAALEKVTSINEEIPIEKPRVNATLFALISTALNLVGLIVAAMIWYEKQSALGTAIGLIFIIGGCVIFGIGMTLADPTTKAKAKRIFGAINVWIILFIPLSIIYNILCGGFITAPYPILIGSPARYISFWFLYIVSGSLATYILQKIYHN